MHVPDGFLDAPTSVATGVGRRGGGGRSALRGARRELDDRTAPLAGLVATFVFATQMLNFPVGAGTSGHLLGGALAAVLVGPWTGVLCMSVVLLVQSLLFADGGITALGTNITLMGIVTVAGRLAGLPRPRSRCCPSGSGWSRRRRASPPWSPCRSPRWSSSASTPSAAQPPIAARHADHGDGRLARADRHRRGRHHRPRGRQRSSRSGPTWCTARARVLRAAHRSRSARRARLGVREPPAGSRPRPSWSPASWSRCCSPASSASTPPPAPTGSTKVARGPGRLPDTSASTAAADGPLAGYGVERRRRRAALGRRCAGVVGQRWWCCVARGRADLRRTRRRARATAEPRDAAVRADQA